MKNDILLKLGYKIKYERMKRKLTQEVLGAMVGLSPQSISTLESGISDVKFTNLYNIAKALDIDLGDFSDFKL